MKIKIAIICLAGAITCSAQETEVPLRDYTLRQCIDYAISHNITVRQSANNVEPVSYTHLTLPTNSRV